METNQVSLALNGVVQAQAGKLAIAGIHIVQVNVFHGGSNNLIPGDLRRRQQEQGGIAHEIFDVVDAELGLYGDVCSTQIVIGIQNVGKTYHLGDILLDSGKLVQNLALSLGKRILPGGGGLGQAAGVQEGVELTHDNILELCQECVIGLFYGDFRAVLVHIFDGYGFRVLLNRQVRLCRLHDGGLAVGDNLAGVNRAALQVNTGGVRHQRRTGGLSDRASDAQNISQRLPVVIKPGNKVDLARGHAGIDIGQRITGLGQSFNFSCCHVKGSFQFIRSGFSASAFCRSAVDIT